MKLDEAKEYIEECRKDNGLLAVQELAELTLRCCNTSNVITCNAPCIKGASCAPSYLSFGCYCFRNLPSL